MRRISMTVIVMAFVIVGLLPTKSAAGIQLNAVTFPEAKTTKLAFTGAKGASGLEMKAKVEFRAGQAQIEMQFDNMKPAVLFGGDVTCYVVWAVSRDGSFSNLGELWMPESHGKIQFTTGRKSFALMITAEAYAMVNRPSELLLLFNLAPKPKKAPSDSFEFSDLTEAPVHQLESIADIAWDSTKALDLLQAEKAYELAQRSSAETYAADMMREASTTLAQARSLASRTKSRLDFSRRSITLSGEAIRISLRRQEAEKLEAEIAERRAEMEKLELRAQQSEESAAASQLKLEQAKQGLLEAGLQQEAALASVQQTQAELRRITQEKQAGELEKQALEQEKERIEAEKSEILSSLEGLRRERERLSSRLEGALSQVAETRSSARGLIVNLPDILFALNEATLKADTKIVLAKLAGILLIMPELQLRVEGHTDATGGEEYNLKLSRQRAESVSTFLEAQGIDSMRLEAAGYGEARPVADNETTQGRQKNRRVEIIIGRGPVEAEAKPEIE